MQENYQDKLAKVEALLAAVLERARARAPGHPEYLSHLLWCEAKRSGAFKWALIRVACRLIAQRETQHATPLLQKG
jgi:hypothetical protein